MRHTISIFAALVACLVCLGAAPASDLKVIQRIPGPDGGWDYASLDPQHGRVLIAHGQTVLTLDVATGRLDPAFAQGDHLHAVVPVPGAGVVVTTNSGDASAKIIDARSGALIASLPTAPDPDGAAYDPATGLVIVVNGDAGKLTLVDPRKKAIAGVIDVGDKLEFPASDGKGEAFVNVESKGEIAVVDIAGRKALKRYPMQGCTRPTGLAYVSGDRLVSSCNGVAKILDAATGREIASLKIGGFPDAVIYDPGRRLAYIPTALDGMLNVVALSGPDDNTIVARVPTQVGARTGAVDPRSGRIYLPAATYGPMAPGTRPTPQPGTFVVLVVGRG